MNKIIKATFVFVGVCLMGLFVALAGGLDWGTERAGMASLIILVAATGLLMTTYDLSE